MRHASPTTSPLRDARRPRRAFTMVEALVAIGAMALVAVGIAAIFQSVGKTVSAGKRLSVLNGYAAMIEQQMRREFAQMSRDGFLVIRNQYADVNADKNFTPGADLVALSPTDTAPRPRRIDEVMFIGKGDYTSSREPLDPNYVARAQFARVYFGHGLRLPSSARANAYFLPQVNDGNTEAPRFGRPNPAGGTPVNQYAKDWTLLRHVTLLSRPETTNAALPPNQVFAWKPGGTGRRVLLDKEWQVALQPATLSLFRSVSALSPPFPPEPVFIVSNYVRAAEGSRVPSFASGLVDIAGCDESDVRGIVCGMTIQPNALARPNYPLWQANFSGWTFTPSPIALGLAKSWMDDAWPTQSNQSVGGTDAGTRIRCEPGPTDYITTISSGTGAQAQSAYRRADQLMLSSSNFIPGCTEFIVEYSFGISDPTSGKLIWHGMNRQADENGDGVISTNLANDPYVVRPYPTACDAAGTARPFSLEYRDQNGGWHTNSTDPSKTPKAGPAYVVPNTLIDDGGGSALVRTWFFGYVDPTATDGRPWAWPTLIRVTMSLTDPNNPGVEETFQFVFPTPGNPL